MSRKIVKSLLTLVVLSFFPPLFQEIRADDKGKTKPSEPLVFSGTVKNCSLTGVYMGGKLEHKDAIIALTDHNDKEFIIDLKFLYDSGLARKLKDRIEVKLIPGDKVNLTCEKPKDTSENIYRVINFKKL